MPYVLTVDRQLTAEQTERLLDQWEEWTRNPNRLAVLSGDCHLEWIGPPEQVACEYCGRSLVEPRNDVLTCRGCGAPVPSVEHIGYFAGHGVLSVAKPPKRTVRHGV